MRTLLLACASAALIATSIVVAQSDPGNAAPQNAAPGVKDAEHVEPGKVGPGSEKNSQVSPTSPDIPAHAQPPPDINLPPGFRVVEQRPWRARATQHENNARCRAALRSVLRQSPNGCYVIAPPAKTTAAETFAVLKKGKRLER